MRRNDDFTPEELIDNFAPLSGKFQNIVFYNRNGNTFYRKAPKPYKPPTDAQLALREKFKQATVFARMILLNPAVKAVYQKRAKPGQTAHNLAINEYMRSSWFGNHWKYWRNQREKSPLFAGTRRVSRRFRRSRPRSSFSVRDRKFQGAMQFER